MPNLRFTSTRGSWLKENREELSLHYKLKSLKLASLLIYFQYPPRKHISCTSEFIEINVNFFILYIHCFLCGFRKELWALIHSVLRIINFHFTVAINYKTNSPMTFYILLMLTYKIRLPKPMWFLIIPLFLLPHDRIQY